MAKKKESGPSFVLTKGNLNDVVKAFKPLIKEDTVRLDIDPTGNLVFSVDDIAIVTQLIVPSTEISFDEPATHFLKLGVLKQIASVVKERITVTIENNMICFLVDESELNMQLPIFDMEPDCSYDEEEALIESLVSESLSKLLDKLSVSRTSGSESTKTMYIGKNGIKLGSRLNIGICKPTEDFPIKELDLNVMPEFYSYLRNACTFGPKLDLIFDGTYLVARTDNLIYKTRALNIEFPDKAIESATAEPLAQCRVPKEPLVDSLNKLSIPLYGMKSEQQSVLMDIKEGKLLAVVKDLGGRTSKADITSVSHEGEASAYTNINHLDASAAAMQADFDFVIYDSVSVLEDESHQIILFNQGD